MLLVNFVVEEDAYNGAVGTVIKISYSEKEGPRKSGALPAYIIVDFPELSIPLADVWDHNNPTHVPIPCYTARCEKGCCTMTTAPLRVCKAITGHKSQGMTVGDGHFWKCVVVALASSRGMNIPGLEQVAISRATSLDCLALLNTHEHPVSLERLMKIGKGPAYDKRRSFEAKLRELEKQTIAPIQKKIAAFSPGEYKSFKAGYDALVQWYRSTVASRQ